MSRTFGEHLAVVQYLVSRLGQPLEDAIRNSEVPLHFHEQMREQFRSPLTIESPDLLVEHTALRLCEPLSEDQPQPCWTAFRAFLQNERRWSRSVVERLDDTSRALVERLPLPAGNPPFQVRGLVLGHIQSGKTATMSALIARAADQGYRLFIILAGLMNDLRAQTQRRLDQEITGGSDERARDLPLVAPEPGSDPWVRLTRSGLQGDFDAGTVQMDVNPRTPKLVVAKKNTRVLRRLNQWLASSPMPLDELAALIIDDEADQASIDIHYLTDDDSPARTNASIRELLGVLPKCAYVGFTATPFANILIDVEVEADLYPRDFIASLPEPAGYMGPRQLFGLGMSPSDLAPAPPEPPPLDVIRIIEQDQLDELDQLTPNGDCPEILSRALLFWLLSCCARLARGQDRDHFSMLVHPSQRTADHATFASVLTGEVKVLRGFTVRPKSFPDFLNGAKMFWGKDFRRVSAEQGLQAHDFDTVWRFARGVAESIEIKVLNKDSDDELDYTGRPKRYIVIGGNRLSRGLTLEGLSVSFFSRNASAYDTLLQMGRWFGFRPGYADLTRIFVEQLMSRQFADLARVELELREDLRKYTRQNDPPSPRQLAPRIRAHPSMAITSRLRMGAGRRIGISFQNTTQSTVVFPTENREIQQNIDAARALIGRLGSPSASASPDGMHFWRDVAAERVLEFLRAYMFGEGAETVNQHNLTGYIRRLNGLGELRLWDVCIPRGNPEREPFSWADGLLSHCVLRTPVSPTSIGALWSPPDRKQWQGLSQRPAGDAPDLGCLFLYPIDRNSGEPGRQFFSEGAHRLGFVLLFPVSQSNLTIPYISQHEQ
jgi:Z1 domain